MRLHARRKILRERPNEVLSIYRERLFDDAAAELAQTALGLDDKRRNLLQAADELKSRRNSASQLIGREKDAEKRAALIKDMESVKTDIAGLDAQLSETEAQLDNLLLQLPNLPDSEVPTGRSDAENQVVRTEGKRFEFGFAPKPHWKPASRSASSTSSAASKSRAAGSTSSKGPARRFSVR